MILVATSFSNCVVSAVHICNKLEVPDINKGASPDEIPPTVLKYCAPVLVPHLAVHFRSLLAVAIFAAIMTCSFVVLIFKQGDKADIRNYRPVVIPLAKLFQNIIQEHNYVLSPQFIY